MERLMLECAVRAALVAMGTGAVLGGLRVKSAGARHGAWLGVLLMMLLLPVWMAFGPRAYLPILPAQPVAVDAVPIELPPAIAPPGARATVQPVRPVSWNWPLAVYLAGVFVLLTRLALGTVRAGRLTSSQIAAPITVGIFRPVVILPAGWRSWPPAQIAAVLAHEGEHARRRDPLVEWLALLNRAIFWFHPLAWWLERHLSALAEEACDAAVLERGHDAGDYAAYLLDLARSVARSGARIQPVAMAMSGSSLPRRIRRILTCTPAPRLTRPRAACLAACCAAVSLAFASAAVDRQPFVPDPPLPPAPPSAPLVDHPQTPAPAPPVPLAPPPIQIPAGAAPLVARRIALYFDFDGMPKEAQARAIASATQFVRGETRDADFVGVLAWSGGRLKIVEDFTADASPLLSAIGRLSGDAGAPVDPMEQMTHLRAATQIMAGFSGYQKWLVYFPARSLPDEPLQAVADAARDGFVTLDAIDVSKPFLVEPGDTVDFAWGLSDQGPLFYLPRNSLELKVDSDGVLRHPAIGERKVAGMTPEQLKASIHDAVVAHLSSAVPAWHGFVMDLSFSIRKPGK